MLKILIPLAALTSMALVPSPLAAEHQDSDEASAAAIAGAMASLDGRWTGTELKRSQVFEGYWVSGPAAFNFTFDAAAMRGRTLNDGEPAFDVTAEDGHLFYAGEVRGNYMEQRRDVVEFWPRDASGNMKLVAEYTIPRSEGPALTIRETYQMHDGTYVRLQEYRLAGSDEPFILMRDARFSRAE